MLKPKRDFKVPEETRKVAETAFPKGNVINCLRAEFEARDLKPDIQLVDEGYMEIDLLVASQDNGLDLVGPPINGGLPQGQPTRSHHFFKFTIAQPVSKIPTNTRSD